MENTTNTEIYAHSGITDGENTLLYEMTDQELDRVILVNFKLYTELCQRRRHIRHTE
jgi:hypothetical protein